MPRAGGRVTVAIATPLEEELLAPIRAVDERLDVLYAPDLLPPTRFLHDHRGIDGFQRDADGERRWQDLIWRAEVLLGIPGDTPDGLAEVVRRNARLRWVQATAAGAGEQVRAAALTADERARVAITSASGVHAAPLAEFCLLGLLAFTKDLPRLLADQRARHWDHYPMAELRHRRVAIVGLGSVGSEVARLAEAVGMYTIGINRTGATDSPHVREIHTSNRLSDLLPTVDAVVITLPLTDETKGMVDERAIASMKPGAILANVGRGGVVDETALVGALREGRLAGAALDVFAIEPLPAESALWKLPNVLLSPHTAALTMRENERIVALFADNLGRYLRDEELENRIDPEQFY